MPNITPEDQISVITGFVLYLYDESITPPLSEAMTMEVNKSLNECERNLGDTALLAKLSASDVVSQEFKYHPACLAGLYNRERAHLNAFEQK